MAKLFGSAITLLASLPSLVVSDFGMVEVKFFGESRCSDCALWLGTTGMDTLNDIQMRSIISDFDHVAWGNGLCLEY